MKIRDRELSIPIIQGGMGVGISLSGLAGAVAACGGMGVISAAHPGYRDPDFYRDPLNVNRRCLKEEIAKAKEIAKGCGLVGVNVMVYSTMRTMSGLPLKAALMPLSPERGFPPNCPRLPGTARCCWPPSYPADGLPG